MVIIISSLFYCDSFKWSLISQNSIIIISIFKSNYLLFEIISLIISIIFVSLIISPPSTFLKKILFLNHLCRVLVLLTMDDFLYLTMLFFFYYHIQPFSETNLWIIKWKIPEVFFSNDITKILHISIILLIYILDH